MMIRCLLVRNPTLVWYRSLPPYTTYQWCWWVISFFTTDFWFPLAFLMVFFSTFIEYILCFVQFESNEWIENLTSDIIKHEPEFLLFVWVRMSVRDCTKWSTLELVDIVEVYSVHIEHVSVPYQSSVSISNTNESVLVYNTRSLSPYQGLILSYRYVQTEFSYKPTLYYNTI